MNDGVTEPEVRYFTTEYESAEHGQCRFFVEFTAGEASRQVTVLGDVWKHSRTDGGHSDPNLTDASVDEVVERSAEIEGAFFELMWTEALSRAT